MLSLLRPLVYCCLASVLAGCSIPQPLTTDEAGPGRPNYDLPTSVETATDILKTPSLPNVQTERKDAHDGGSQSTGMSESATAKNITQKKSRNIGDENDTTHGDAVTATDDDLIELWRNDMNAAMEQPADQRILRISSAVETHHRVRFYVDGFRGRMRDFFERALARSGKYRSMMANILRSEGLPEKLVYLALIESGFSPHAYSRAHALGPWQFIRATALQYGLTINSWVDERRDPVLSTRAAANYLKDLHEKFGEWFLAAAAYNAGEGRVGTALQRSRTNDYWLLRQERQHLKLETRDYVPKFVAAALIAGEPERYGFEQISYEAPMEYDEVTIHQPMRLETIARLAQTQLDVIKELNPSLLRNFTPPMDRGFKLRLPVRSQSVFLAGYEQLPSSATIKLTLHKVKKGDQLERIAKRNHVTPAQLAKDNDLKSWRLRPGQELIIVSNDSGNDSLRSAAVANLLDKAP